jgi:hypothetical protein
VETVQASFKGAILDQYVVSLDIAQIAQALPEELKLRRVTPSITGG